jgi:hypothetical protein
MNAYVEAASGVTSLGFIQSTGISVGTSYKFKVKGRNAVGFSNYSAEFIIISATVPE